MAADLQNLPELVKLTPAQRIYVLRRARGVKHGAAATDAGVSRQAALQWDSELIDSAIFAVQIVLFASPTDALSHLIPAAVDRIQREISKGGMVGYLAAKEVFDRTWGKAPQGIQLSGELDLSMKGYTTAATPARWDDDPPPEPD